MDPDIINAARDVALGIGGALAGKPLLEKLLGPSFDYVGHTLASLLERYGNKNVENIFRRAVTLLGNKADDEGTVDPRILRAVIEDGCFASDPLAQTYFAGVLASSRGPTPSEDRGLLFLSTLKSLSNAEVAVHYRFYSWLRSLFVGAPFPLTHQSDHDVFALFIPTERIDPDDVRADDAIIGLANAGLLGNAYELSQSVRFNTITSMDGRVLTPSHFGIRLFLWVHGYPNESVDALLRADYEFQTLFEISCDNFARPLGLHRVRLALVEKLDAMPPMTIPNNVWPYRSLAYDAAHFLWPDCSIDIPEALRKDMLTSAELVAVNTWLANLRELLMRNNLEVMTRSA